VANSYYELAGGADGMQRLAEAFYSRVLVDPVLLPLFRDPTEDHAGRMALWLGEFFGGPYEHTRQRGGFSTVVDAHRSLNITDEQRQHWINHMRAACKELNLSDKVMEFFDPHILFGARAAQNMSHF
jgi:hemoglobin